MRVEAVTPGKRTVWHPAHRLVTVPGGGHGCRGRSQHCPSPCRKGPSAQVRIGAGSPAGAVAGDRRRALVDLGVTTGATWSRGHGPSRPGAVGRAGRIEYTEQPLAKRRSRDVTGTGDVARRQRPRFSVRDQSGEVVGSAASLPMPTASWSRLTPSRRSCVIVGVLLRTPCSPRWMWVLSWDEATLVDVLAADAGAVGAGDTGPSGRIGFSPTFGSSPSREGDHCEVSVH